ncbi:MAG TPA: HAMP domain-containing sensor histidine kinase [Noviherbaspirillum sp.]|nr:HAMP domain-containing sensor histidine kinase [Noviherbaspirillum sp.]
MKNSLRWRLAWTFTLLSTFAVLIQAVALFVSTEEQEEDMINEVINATLDNQIRQPGSSLDVSDLPAAPQRMQLFRLSHSERPPELPENFATLPVGIHEWYKGETEYHVGIRDHGSERFYLMYDASEHEERLEQLGWKLLMGLALLSVASLWLGYWLAGRVLYQLDAITQRVQRDDEAALNEPGLDREVALLADALDHYRQRNRELLEREREFTANVSHELRTPLTRIRTSAELLAEDAALPAREKERAGRIIAAVDAMESRLRGLLFLGRELALDERKPLDLKKYAEASAMPLRQPCEARGVQISVDIPEHATVHADASLLQLLLDNLIGNAARYTQRGSIDIHYADGTLTVSDTGPGIAPEHLARVFDRHYRASDAPGGMGLGLSIVKRVCAAHGWTCSIDSVAADGDARQGTRVAVFFNG